MILGATSYISSLRRNESITPSGEMCSRLETDNEQFDKETLERVLTDLTAHPRILSPDTHQPMLPNSERPISRTHNDERSKRNNTKNEDPCFSQLRKPEIIDLPPAMIHRLTIIFNASLTSGFFPIKYKSLITLNSQNQKKP